jgi:hypothetical protein
MHPGSSISSSDIPQDLLHCCTNYKSLLQELSAEEFGCPLALVEGRDLAIHKVRS